jgi:hypothetical protein
VQVEIETPSIEQFDPKPAIDNWMVTTYLKVISFKCSLQDWINISLNVTKLEDHMTYRFVTMFTRLEIKKYIYDYKTIEFHSYNL